LQQHFLTIEQATACLRAGQVIAYPTEAVYGLGCDPDNAAAVHGILSMKHRSAAAGLILIADTFDRLQPYLRPVPSEQLDRALATWPGPVTWLFPRAPGVPDHLAGNHATIAVRVSAHPVCRRLCQAFGAALVSTSANPAGAPPALSAAQVEDYFAGQLAGIVEGEIGGQLRPSEIRDLSTGKIIRAA
jgi:L-threonylcarbamoyladenylate synthase